MRLRALRINPKSFRTVMPSIKTLTIIGDENHAEATGPKEEGGRTDKSWNKRREDDDERERRGEELPGL